MRSQEQKSRSFVRAPLFVLLAAALLLTASCGGNRSQSSTSGNSDAASPHGSDWALEEPNVRWYSMLTWDVDCRVYLLRDRKYADGELLSVAKKVVQYVVAQASSQRREVGITGVNVYFFPPKGTPAAVVGQSAIASVEWSAGEGSNVTDFSSFKYALEYNYARRQRAGEANAYGL